MKFHATMEKLAVICAITLLSVNAFAMGSPGHNNPEYHHGGCMQQHDRHKGMMKEGHKMLPWILKKELGLSGKQAGEISDIMAEEHLKGKPLFEAMHKERKALRDISIAKSDDKAAIKTQSGRLAEAFAAMAAHHAQVHKRIAAVMTKEQAVKFETLAADFGKHENQPHDGKAPCGMEQEKCQMHMGCR